MERISMNKQVAIILGGTFPHISLLEKLKERGYYTVLIDFFENPPAKLFADEHVMASTLDKDTVLEISKQKKASLVISAYIDQANVTACYVAEKLNLPHPYSYETALNVTNKLLMKSLMLNNNIPTSKFVVITNIDECEGVDLSYPVIVKPTDSNSSKGVRKADSLEELKSFAEKAFEISRNKKVIIEEYIIGKEIGIDCYISNGKATVLITKERRKIPAVMNQNEQIFGCIWPMTLSDSDFKPIEQIAERISMVFGLDNTPLMIQAIVNQDGINVIEFGARFGGGESFRIIKLATGFDPTSAVIDSYLGNEFALNHEIPEFYYADNFIYAKQGNFNEILGFESFLDDNTIEYIDSYKTKGALIGNELSSNNRVGVFTVKAKDKTSLMKKINSVLSNIDVIDLNGRSIMKRDIYLNTSSL
jgi:carbamoylphosphate synthase large subunit